MSYNYDKQWSVAVEGPYRGTQPTCSACDTKVNRAIAITGMDHYAYVCLPCLNAMRAEMEASMAPLSGTWTWRP